MKSICVHIFLFVLSITLSKAQVDSVEQKVYKNNILPSPTFTYSPRTDVVLGLYLLYQFKFDRKDHNTRPSNINIYYGSSYKGQNYLSSEHTILTNHEQYYFKGIFEYKKTPEKLYRLGPDSPNEEWVNAEYHSIEFKERFLKQIQPKIFMGARIRSINIFDVSYQKESGEAIEPPPELPYADGGSYLGIGPVFMWDKRNSILTPTKNYYLDVAAVFYKSLMDKGSFFILEIDGRRYHDLTNDGKNVLAYHLLFKSTFGDVPFHELSMIGGKQILRGYELGRFRDDHAIQLQAEFRKNIIGRFGATAFVGTGTVFDEFQDFQHLKAALGGGLRFNINRKDPTNVRIDFAWSVTDYNKGLYITLGEAF
ncbi:BamA/TamA family outer membrane protein [Flammeovirga sp. SubArs3]|uniref:BamA/TamA family outer membrane protein n=1 Tax=Flammeovirga sp. SubArs3 TaxID=2995316 RepID=UPI00248C10C0|nr:BamA/TamA family outer membrane protein [Flammeovirga sp. SubArs3]